MDLCRNPDFDEEMAMTYFADSGVNLEPLERAWNAQPGVAMTDEEFRSMLGLFRTISIGKPANLGAFLH